MKELSIEEKAKRYDEAIKVLRTMMPKWENLSYNGKTFLKDLVHIFPELKESEDEKIISRIKKAVESYWSDEPLHEILDWLKKQAEQKPAGWSKEDEKMYDRIVRSYTSYEGRILHAKDLSDDNRNNILEDLNEQELWLKHRLKSLRPQNTWKPSDEQIEALDFATDCIVPDEFNKKRKVLKELLEQLKAL